MGVNRTEQTSLVGKQPTLGGWLLLILAVLYLGSYLFVIVNSSLAAVQYMNIIFVCNEELKGGHARLFTLFTW